MFVHGLWADGGNVTFDRVEAVLAGKMIPPDEQRAMSKRAGVRLATALQLFRWMTVTQATRRADAGTIEDRFSEVNGLSLHDLAAGSEEPVILLHGYAETSHMWWPPIAALAATHTVIAPDLRGFDQSDKPEGGYDKKTMAQDVHALAVSVGFREAKVVGHDIGLMVAYAYAAQYPAEVRSPRADGRVFAGHRQLGERLAVARLVAFPLLWRGAAQAGRRS